MSETTYYQRNRETILNGENDYYNLLFHIKITKKC